MEQEKKLVVLVVDDDKMVRDIIKSMLKRINVAILTANNGVEAQEIIESKEIDLIISDLQMPWLDGLSLLSWQKEHSEKDIQRIPFVLMSGNLDNEIIEMAKEAGAIGVEYKPITMTLLEKLITSIKQTLD